MNLIPYSYKRILCNKRLRNRESLMYKDKVNEILRTGQTELNGLLYTSIAELTITFYEKKKASNG